MAKLPRDTITHYEHDGKGNINITITDLIRCKDCKNWVIGKTTKNYPNPYICDLHSFMHGFERSALPEDYCSWAELRGDSE